MAGRIGLYYPYIHFRDDSWIKLAALYWGRVARIVPRGYPTRDSRVVRELDASLGLIVNQPPSSAAYSIGAVFAEVIARHSDRLRERYLVQADDVVWNPNRPRHPPGSPADEDRVAWIHVSKMDPELRDVLLTSGVAIGARGGDPSWIGVHPKVAEVYMTALADQIALDRSYEPITDDPLHHIAVSGWSLEQLAAALLGELHVEAGPPDTEVALAFLAIQSLLPRDLATVPVERIVEVRQKYGAELTRFRDSLASLPGLAVLETVRDVESLKAHLELAYSERIKPQLEALKRDLRLLKLDTALSVVDVKVAVPGALAGIAGAAGAGVPSEIAAGSGVAVGMATMLASQCRQRGQHYSNSPAAYLLRVEEGLNPATMSARVQRGLRRFTTGV